MQPMANIVLASASKPRAQILTRMGIKFTQIATNVPEDLDPRAFSSCEAYCDATCRLKCGSIVPEGNTVYVTADTVVIVSHENGGDELLEKPKDREDAERMLMLYVKYKQARIYSSICVRISDKTLQRGCTTLVNFRKNLSQNHIEAFMREHYDTIKAGSGALVVLGPTWVLIDSVQGCWLNGAGLSPAVLLDLLDDIA